jgi:hypothetical protein
VSEASLKREAEAEEAGIDHSGKRYCPTQVDLMIAFLRSEIDKTKRGV